MEHNSMHRSLLPKQLFTQPSTDLQNVKATSKSVDRYTPCPNKAPDLCMRVPLMLIRPYLRMECRFSKDVPWKPYMHVPLVGRDALLSRRCTRSIHVHCARTSANCCGLLVQQRRSSSTWCTDTTARQGADTSSSHCNRYSCASERCLASLASRWTAGTWSMQCARLEKR